MSQTWFHSKIALDFGAVPAHAEPLQALFAGTISSDIAAERIASSDLKRKDDTAWRLWQLIFDAAVELPQFHPTLIRLVLALQTKHDAAPGDAGLAEWMKMGNHYRDRLDILWARREGVYDKQPLVPSAEQRYINFIVWSAQLLSSTFRPSTQVVKALAWSELSRVLESEPESYDDSGTSRTLEQRQGLMRLDIKAVAHWILHAAPALRSDEGEPDRGSRFLPAQRGLWLGSARGFTLERWTFWKERFHSYVHSGILDREAVDIVKVAISKMD